MKIKEEEGVKEEDSDIETKEIKNEEVESSFRASISRFSYPSSPPSARRTPKRPPPGSNPNPPPPPSSPSLTVTVAVAPQPTPAVRQDEGNNDESVGSGAVQALRRSPRKRKGETRPRLDAGDGDGGGDTRPSKKMKKMRRGNPRAPEVDLSRLPRQGALPEYLAEDLDGTFLLPIITPRLLHSGLHKMIVLAHFRTLSSAVPPVLLLLLLESPDSAILRNQVRGFLSLCFFQRIHQLVDSKHHKAQGARLVSSDTTTQIGLTIFGRACISPVSILFPQTVALPPLRQVSFGLTLVPGKRVHPSPIVSGRGLHSSRNV